MAFSWTSITAGVTNITAAQMNEVKTNVDHLTTQLGVTAYSWSTLPVSQYAKANAANLTELQTAISYVDTLNVCASYNATHNSGILSGDDNSIHTGKDASILTGQDAAIHTGKDVSIHTGKDAAIHTGKDVSIHSGKDASIHTGKDVSYNNAVQTTYHNNRDISVLNGQYSTVYNPQYVSNCSTNWSSAQNGANGVVNSSN